MQVLVNTDSYIDGTTKLTQEVEARVQQALGRFGDRITRVEVFLSDENSSQKYGDADKRCVIEARLGGLQPITVSHQGSTLDQAVAGAADKLEKTLKRTLGRKDSLYKRRICERAELAAVDPLLTREAEDGRQESFIKLLRPLLGHLGNHARSELRIMTANGRLYPGQVDFADLLDEVVTRAWSQFANRPRWISLDLWLTKLLDETLNEWAKEAPPVHEALQDRTDEALPQKVPHLDDHEWWACLLGDDEKMTPDNATASCECPPVEECLEAEELMYRIHTLLGELPTTQRHAFVLNVLEAYGLSEIAMLQGRPENQVQADIESARKQLRERLQVSARPQMAADDTVGVLATGPAKKT